MHARIHSHAFMCTRVDEIMLHLSMKWDIQVLYKGRGLDQEGSSEALWDFFLIIVWTRCSAIVTVFYNSICEAAVIVIWRMNAYLLGLWFGLMDLNSMAEEDDSATSAHLQSEGPWMYHVLRAVKNSGRVSSRCTLHEDIINKVINLWWSDGISGFLGSSVDGIAARLQRDDPCKHSRYNEALPWWRWSSHDALQANPPASAAARARACQNSLASHRLRPDSQWFLRIGLCPIYIYVRSSTRFCM